MIKKKTPWKLQKFIVQHEKRTETIQKEEKKKTHQHFHRFLIQTHRYIYPSRFSSSLNRNPEGHPLSQKLSSRIFLSAATISAQSIVNQSMLMSPFREETGPRDYHVLVRNFPPFVPDLLPHRPRSIRIIHHAFVCHPYRANVA